MRPAQVELPPEPQGTLEASALFPSAPAAIRPSVHPVEVPSQKGPATSTATHCPHPAHKLTNLFPARDFITGHDFKVAQCTQCGFAITTPQPALHELPG